MRMLYCCLYYVNACLVGCAVGYWSLLPTPTLATIHLSSGWATFGQVLSQGVARDGLQLGVLPTQTDIKNRWPDGSIRFAVVSVKITEDADYPLRAAAPPADVAFPARPTLPEFWFTIRDLGRSTLYGAGFFAGAVDTTWLDGPLVRERWTRLNFRAADGTAHPYLWAVLGLREYADGTCQFDVTVENCQDAAGAQVRCTAHAGVGSDVLLWTRTNFVHPYLTRYRKVFRVGPAGDRVPPAEPATIVPDLTQAVVVNALPKYDPRVGAAVYWVWGPEFDVLGPGPFDPYMPGHGGREEIAPYPDWTARYLVHRDVNQRDYVLAGSNAGASFPVHVREPNGEMVSIDRRPNYWLDARGEDGPLGNLTQTGPLTPDIAHQPSISYVPYLLSGDYFHLREMQFWANYCLLATFQDSFYNARGGAEGLLYGNEVRGIGWALRNLVDAARWSPDGDPWGSHFAAKVQNNLAWLDANSAGLGPLRILYHDRRPENWEPGFDAFQWIAMWEQNYLAWALDHAARQGFTGGIAQRDRIVRLQHLLFNEAADLRDGAAPYLLPVGTRNPAGSTNITWRTTARQMYQGAVESFGGAYGPDARSSLLIAERLGLPNARAHRLWLEQQDTMPACGGRDGWWLEGL